MKFQYGPQNWYQAISCNIWNDQDLSPPCKENLWKKLFLASFWVILGVIFSNSYVLENSRAGIASNALPIQMARMVPITIYLEVRLFKGQTIALYLKYI